MNHLFDSGPVTNNTQSKEGGFVNAHLSVSRLKLYEQCPRAFFDRYVSKSHTRDGVTMVFGTFIHRILERYWRRVVDTSFVGRIDENELLEILDEDWQCDPEYTITQYLEARHILKGYAETVRIADHRQVLGIETPFEMQLGRFRMIGFMDRVEKLNDTTIRIIDYKTNHLPFTRDEVENDLQMSVYSMAAKQLWPWATRIELVFHILRHNLFLGTTRTDAQLAEAAAYVQLLGEKSEADYSPKVGAHCSWCESRHTCDAFANALCAPKPVGSSRTLEELVREREFVASRAKMFYARRAEIDSVLRKKLEESGPIEVDGARVSLEVGADRVVSARSARRVLGDLASEDVLDDALIVDRTKLANIVFKVERVLGRGRAALLRAELDAVSECVQAPRVVVYRKGGAR